MIEMYIKSIKINENSSKSIMILSSKDTSERNISLKCSILKAKLAVNYLENIIPKNKGIFELTSTIINHLNGIFERIVIYKRKSDRFAYKALLHISVGNHLFAFDCEDAADAILLALKNKVLIYCEEKLLGDEAGQSDEVEHEPSEEQKKIEIRQRISSLKLEQFGKALIP